MLGRSTTADTQILVLEDCAARAGAAMACVFSSSAEFDAALIAERRAAGVYGSRRRWHIPMTAVGLVAALVLIFFFLSDGK
jgi:hypothetical protein